MELKNFVQWCVNQYLDLIQMFKQSLYKLNSNFQPNLVERIRLEKLLYLTLLFNNDTQFLKNEGEDILSEIGMILDSLYEKVHGYWNGTYSTHMNLWKYAINIEYGCNCFFFQLFITELFIIHSGDQTTVNWIEDYMINTPIQYEKSNDEFERPLNLQHSIKPEENIQKLSWLLENYRGVFDLSEWECFRLDTLAVQLFYEKYFYMKSISKRKDTLYRVIVENKG